MRFDNTNDYRSIKLGIGHILNSFGLETQTLGLVSSLSWLETYCACDVQGKNNNFWIYTGCKCVGADLSVRAVHQHAEGSQPLTLTSDVRGVPVDHYAVPHCPTTAALRAAETHRQTDVDLQHIQYICIQTVVLFMSTHMKLAVCILRVVRFAHLDSRKAFQHARCCMYVAITYTGRMTNLSIHPFQWSGMLY